MSQEDGNIAKRAKIDGEGLYEQGLVPVTAEEAQTLLTAPPVTAEEAPVQALTDEELCVYEQQQEDGQCIKTITENNRTITCSSNEEACFTDTAHTAFYDRMNWANLASIITYKLKEFNEECSADETIKNYVRTLFNYDHTINQPLFIITPLTKNENLTKCHDLNFSFGLACGPPTKPSIKPQKPTEFRIFHIALHSRASKYKIGKTRSQDTCGFYKREGTSSGPFHYKIDNNQRDLTEFTSKSLCIAAKKFSETQSPYKEFSYNDNFRFTENDGNADVNHGFTVPAGTVVSPQCLEFNKYMYNKFVGFWNQYILPEIYGSTSSSSSLGGRKLNLSKKRRRSNRRTNRRTNRRKPKRTRKMY